MQTLIDVALRPTVCTEWRGHVIANEVGGHRGKLATNLIWESQFMAPSMKWLSGVFGCCASWHSPFGASPCFPGGLKPRGLGASSSQHRRSQTHQRTAFREFIRTPPPWLAAGSVKLHSSSASVRSTAFSSGATPIRAHGPLACDARWGLGAAAWGRLRTGRVCACCLCDPHGLVTERFVFLSHRKDILQHSPGID